MGPATGNHNPHNWLPTTMAGLTGPTISPDKLIQVGAPPALGIDIVTTTATAVVNTELQDLLEIRPQTTNLPRCQLIHRSAGIQPSGPEDFVGIDVTAAGQNRLIQQAGLNAPSPATQTRNQLGCGDN